MNSVTLKDVLFIPNLTANLISIKKLTDKGFRMIFEEIFCSVPYGSTVLATAIKDFKIYKVKLATE